MMLKMELNWNIFPVFKFSFCIKLFLDIKKKVEINKFLNPELTSGKLCINKINRNTHKTREV